MMGGEARSEGGRRLAHLLFGVPALILPVIDWRLGLAIALGALVANIEFLPRTTIGRGFIRPDEGRLGGIVLYPLTVALLILVFRDHLEFAAMGWIVLATGDPAAAAFGRGSAGRWPWNARKSPRGSLAFVAAALGGGTLLGLVTGATLPAACGAALPSALLGALVESLPRPKDDNLTVGFAAAIAQGLLRGFA